MGASTGKTKRIDTTTKPSWSNPSNALPRSIFSLRLRKLPRRSPVRAPIASNSPASHLPCRNPMKTPAMMPATKPLIDFPGPKILLPSGKFFPKSIGLPPPSTTGAPFAKYAGRMNSRAVIVGCMISVTFSLPWNVRPTRIFICPFPEYYLVLMREIKKTTSVCPECLKILPATIYEDNGKVWIKKTCKKHGKFEELYWGSYDFYKRAERYAKDGKGLENPNVDKKKPVCPKDCGLCNLHKSHTALANIVLTNRCDLTCWYCFFYAKRMGYIYEPTIEQIDEMVKMLRSEKPIACNAVQLTGREPTLRDDLIDIINVVRERGIDHIQLNTNGIRLAFDPDLTRQVKEAGVNTLYMSFDGVSEKSNPKNHWEAPLAIENARKVNLGVVLVPTVIKGVNDHELGDMIKYGFKNIDVIRGVNLQPVSLVGRMPRREREKSRITIPDVIENIGEQTDGQIQPDDFFPVPTAMIISEFLEALNGRPMYDMSSHFACGAATYVFGDRGKLVPLTRFLDVEGFLEYLCEKTEGLKEGKSKLLTKVKLGLALSRFLDKDKVPKGIDLDKLIYQAFIRHNYDAIGKFHMKSLFIGMMHFQDLYNYDIERVKRCCIHYAMTDGRVIPFCAFNVIPEWYRDKNQAAQGVSFEEWENKTGLKLKEDLYRRDRKKLKATKAYKKFERQIKQIQK